MDGIKSLPFLFLGLFWLAIFSTSCSSTVKAPQWSGSGFLKKQFLDYKKVAILPFEGDRSGETTENFMQTFHKRFPQMELVGPKQLLEVFRKEDLYPNRVSETTRRKIQETFGVQALVMGSVYYPSITRWLLQVQIVDSGTNEVLGRSLAQIDYMGAEGVKEGCEVAIHYLTPE